MKSATVDGAALVRAREARGMTQDEVARMVGITQGAMSRMERGTLQPSGATFRALIKVLRIPRESALKPQPEPTEDAA